MSRFTSESKGSILVPLGGGLATFAIIGLGHSANHPEDFARRHDAVAPAASESDPSSDSHFTRQSQGLLGDAVRAKARAAEPKPCLEQVRNALERDKNVDQPLRSQGPAGSLLDSTEGPVLPLEP